MRLLIRWFLNALTLFGIAYFAGQLHLNGFSVDGYEAALTAAAVLAILNLIVRPVIKLFALPITCLTFGLFTLVINAAMMLLTEQLVVGFRVGGFRNAVIASLIYAVVSAILNNLLNKDRD